MSIDKARKELQKTIRVGRSGLATDIEALAREIARDEFAKLSPAPVGAAGYGTINVDQQGNVTEAWVGPTPPAATSDGEETTTAWRAKLLIFTTQAEEDRAEGPRCRDCADEDGRCPGKLVACDPMQALAEAYPSRLLALLRDFANLEQRLAEADAEDDRLEREVADLTEKLQFAHAKHMADAHYLATAERQRDEATAMVERLRGGLKAMTEHYVSLAGCGDCGIWNPEEEAEVIAARALLSEPQASEGRDG